MISVIDSTFACAFTEIVAVTGAVMVYSAVCLKQAS